MGTWQEQLENLFHYAVVENCTSKPCAVGCRRKPRIVGFSFMHANIFNLFRIAQENNFIRLALWFSLQNSWKSLEHFESSFRFEGLYPLTRWVLYFAPRQSNYMNNVSTRVMSLWRHMSFDQMRKLDIPQDFVASLQQLSPDIFNQTAFIGHLGYLFDAVMAVLLACQ